MGLALRCVTVASHPKITFILIGIWNTIFAISFFSLLSNYAGKNWYPLSLFLVYLSGTFQSHFLNRKFVWKSSNNYTHEFSKFGVMSVIIYLLNVLILKICLARLEFSIITIQLVISICLAGLSFMAQKELVYRKIQTS